MGLSEDKTWLGIAVSEKGQIAKEYLDGRADLHELARPHSLSRNLIRLWIRKYEAGAFIDELAEGCASPSTSAVVRGSAVF